VLEQRSQGGTRALLSLLEEDAFCYDTETGCIDKASRVYQTVPVEVMG
jgi:hypothetical protein